MTDLKVIEVGGGLIFADPLEDDNPIVELPASTFPMGREELIRLLGELGNDVDYLRDPA